MILIETQKYALAFFDASGHVIGRTVIEAETIRHARAIAAAEASTDTVSFSIWEIPEVVFKQSIMLRDDKQLVQIRSLVDRLDGPRAA